MGVDDYPIPCYTTIVTVNTRDSGYNVDTMVRTQQLNASDRCDHSNCSAQALTLVKFMNGDLLFCGHHFAQYEDMFYTVAYDIIDERDKINVKSESSA